MERDPCREALGIEVLLGEILMRVGCTKSLVRSTLVSKSWLKTARSPVVVAGFTDRNKPSFLGFITECRGIDGDATKLISPPGGPTNDSVRAMRARFNASCLSGVYVLGSHGGRVISRMEAPGRVHSGIYMICPYANPRAFTLAACPIPPIERTPGQHTLNTYGQFAVLPPSDLIGSAPVGFSVRDAAGFFDRSPEGVRFNSDSSVYVHVRVFRNNRWNPIVFGPLAPPARAMFHRNPYCVEASSMVYMMYLLGFIVCLDLEQESFGVVDLPGEMADSVKSGLDYTVGPHPEGHLAVIHADNGILVKWVLVRKGDSADWHIETSVDLLEAFTEMINRGIVMAMIDGPLDWSSVQVRRVCSDARFVFISIGLNQGLFVVDMLEKKAREVRNVVRDGLMGRVFPLSENWPPMQPLP